MERHAVSTTPRFCVAKSNTHWVVCPHKRGERTGCRCDGAEVRRPVDSGMRRVQRSDAERAYWYWWQGSLQSDLQRTELHGGSGDLERTESIPLATSSLQAADLHGNYWVVDSAVDSRQDLVFATVQEGKLLKMAASGFDLEVLSNEVPSHSFNGIAVDEEANLVYWVDESVGIKSINYDGSGEKVVIKLKSLRDICLSEKGGKIYFTDGPTSNVGVADLATGEYEYIATNVGDGAGTTGIAAAFGQLYVGTKNAGLYQMFPDGSLDPLQMIPMTYEIHQVAVYVASAEVYIGAYDSESESGWLYKAALDGGDLEVVWRSPDGANEVYPTGMGMHVDRSVSQTGMDSGPFGHNGRLSTAMMRLGEARVAGRNNPSAQPDHRAALLGLSVLGFVALAAMAAAASNKKTTRMEQELP